MNQRTVIQALKRQHLVYYSRVMLRWVARDHDTKEPIGYPRQATIEQLLADKAVEEYQTSPYNPGKDSVRAIRLPESG